MRRICANYFIISMQTAVIDCNYAVLKMVEIFSWIFKVNLPDGQMIVRHRRREDIRGFGAEAHLWGPRAKPF